MSEALEVRAEILKMARLLGHGAEDLAYLETVASEDLRALREQVTEVVFGSQAAVLGRLAAASRLLPTSLVAQLAERTFGPVLSARVAGLLEPDRAVDMASKLPIPFLADIAVELDPRRAVDVIGRIPPTQIAAVSRELTRRGEYVAMGRFVGYLPDASINAALGAMDPVALLNVSFVLENKEKLGDVVALIEPERFDAMIRLAIDSDLEDEALELMAFLSPDQRARVMALPDFQHRRAS
jgi:hypothetical protein